MRSKVAALSIAALALTGSLASAQPAPPEPPPAPVPSKPEPSPPAAPETPPLAPLPAAPEPPPAPLHAAPEAPPTPQPSLRPEQPHPAPPPEPAQPSAPLAGFHGSFFLRDPSDMLRLYPRGRMAIDAHSFFGSGVSAIAARDGGNALKARLFLRRAQVELAGQLLKRWSFHVQVELASQPLGNANGAAEQAAAAAGQEPTAATARFAPVQTIGAGAALADAWINLFIAPEIQLMVGQYDAPITMENRTNSNIHTWMERSLAIRGFVAPANKEIGLTAWGELGSKWLVYEAGVFAGDGPNRPQIDNRADVMGRVFARPFGGSDGALAGAQIGVSARHGDRDQGYVGYTYPAITTGQGFVLWDPRYRDSAGRVTHVIPSGAQNLIGGELRLPVGKADVRAEGYYVVNHTREALDGYQLTNTERLGDISGIGWYLQAGFWPLGDAFVNGDPGFFRPTSVNLEKPAPPLKKGLEVYAMVGGVSAVYRGASRGGEADAKTPGSAGGPSGTISIYEYGLGATYWHSRHVRLSLNYIAYHAPGSGSAENLASVPGNLGKSADKGVHVLHELSSRVALMF